MPLIDDDLWRGLQTMERGAFEHLAMLMVEEALKALPIVNENIARKALALRSASEEFYKEHPDLVGNKALVASVIERLEAENPGLAYDKLLKLAAPEAKRLAKIQPSEPKKRLAELDTAVGSFGISANKNNGEL